MRHPIINPYLKLFLKNGSAHRNAGYFHALDFRGANTLLRTKKSAFWEHAGEKMALSLFHTAARRVPAYKNFLAEYGVKPSRVRSIKDFTHVPITDKENYLRRYPLKDLCWDGVLAHNTLFSVSSGSSGKPFFWPRGDNLELETTLTHGMILKEVFAADRIPTLFINSFSMGIYIAGVVILNSALRSAETGWPLTIVTPGVEIDDVIRIVRELAPSYQQIVLAGYPPFIKDIIDSGEAKGAEWRKLHMRFLFAAENFTETFRDYIFEKTGVEDFLRSSVNIYGTADASILGHETPFSVALRRMAQRDKELFSALFGEASYAPTLVQYNPLLKFFEEVGGNLIFSTYGGIPLLRYDIHDAGRLVCFNDLMAYPAVKRHTALMRLGAQGWKLPFCQVFGRSDFSISFYGVKIYPENIKEGLGQKEIRDLVSGRFVMEAKNTVHQDQYWAVNIELKNGVRKNARRAQHIAAVLMRALREKNLEYDRLSEAIGRKAKPRLRLFTRGEGRHFDARAVKQRWTVPA